MNECMHICLHAACMQACFHAHRLKEYNSHFTTHTHTNTHARNWYLRFAADTGTFMIEGQRYCTSRCNSRLSQGSGVTICVAVILVSCVSSGEGVLAFSHCIANHKEEALLLPSRRVLVGCSLPHLGLISFVHNVRRCRRSAAPEAVSGLAS